MSMDVPGGGHELDFGNLTRGFTRYAELGPRINELGSTAHLAEEAARRLVRVEPVDGDKSHEGYVPVVDNPDEFDARSREHYGSLALQKALISDRDKIEPDLVNTFGGQRVAVKVQGIKGPPVVQTARPIRLGYHRDEKEPVREAEGVIAKIWPKENAVILLPDVGTQRYRKKGVYIVRLLGFDDVSDNVSIVGLPDEGTQSSLGDSRYVESKMPLRRDWKWPPR